MKKILSVLCVLAFVASFAVIGVSADDAAAVTFTAVAEPVAPGATEFTVDIQATLPAGDDDASTVTQFYLFLDYDDGLKLNKIKKAYTEEGMWTFSQTLDTKPQALIWVAGTASLPTGETTTLLTLTFECPAAEVGQTYNVDITLNADDMPATIGSVKHENATATGVTVAVAEPVVTTTPAPETDPVTSEVVTTEAPESSAVESSVVTDAKSEAPVSSETDATTTTKAPDKATQTGDMMFVVVAVMVVALGAAVVVKKVSVR